MMRVIDLIEELKKFNPNLLVVYDLHSDYAPLQADGIKVIEGISKDYYIMRYYPYQRDRMDPKDLEKLTTYLCLTAG